MKNLELLESASSSTQHREAIRWIIGRPQKRSVGKVGWQRAGAGRGRNDGGWKFNYPIRVQSVAAIILYPALLASLRFIGRNHPSPPPSILDFPCSPSGVLVVLLAARRHAQPSRAQIGLDEDAFRFWTDSFVPPVSAAQPPPDQGWFAPLPPPVSRPLPPEVDLPG